MTFADAVIERARTIELVCFDVDGVLTDGRIVYSERGDEIKAFHVQDGSAIKLLASHGIPSAIVTGRRSELVARRAAELGIEHVLQGVPDKGEALRTLAGRLSLAPAALAHVGDDLPDIPAFELVGLAVGVPNGHPAALAYCHHVTSLAGGRGVAREICELLLRARGRWPYGS